MPLNPNHPSFGSGWHWKVKPLGFLWQGFPLCKQWQHVETNGVSVTMKLVKCEEYAPPLCGVVLQIYVDLITLWPWPVNFEAIFRHLPPVARKYYFLRYSDDRFWFYPVDNVIHMKALEILRYVVAVDPETCLHVAAGVSWNAGRSRECWVASTRTLHWPRRLISAVLRPTSRRQQGEHRTASRSATWNSSSWRASSSESTHSTSCSRLAAASLHR